MTGFALSPERRSELAALLEDEEHLRQAFPKVADYLATSPSLPGTGNDAADRAFDVRLLHFMTGGESDNPYWDIVGPAVGTGPVERNGRREVNGGTPGGSGRLAYAQLILQATYAYAIPSPQTVQWIARHCAGRGLLELGAGRGYWAYQLGRIGLDVAAFDSEPPDRTRNVSFPDAAGQQQIWHEVGGPADLADAWSANRVLFLCWPPGWGNPMSSEALASYAQAGGDRLIYIGEPPGGKTGTDDFFASLAAEWILVDQDPAYVAWWNLRDVAQFWTRRS